MAEKRCWLTGLRWSKIQGNNVIRPVSILLVLAAIAMLGCRKAEGEHRPPPTVDNGLPVIMVDAEHMQVKHADGSEPLRYEIPAGAGFVLDGSAYDFQLPQGADYTTPNLIQVSVNKQAYSMVWNMGDKAYTVSPETLKPLMGALPFTGLVSGSLVYIAIGHILDDGSNTGEVFFTTLWGGIAHVR
jgi:hypothetical protein